jgi:hypothetical protein
MLFEVLYQKTEALSFNKPYQLFWGKFVHSSQCDYRQFIQQTQTGLYHPFVLELIFSTIFEEHLNAIWGNSFILVLSKEISLSAYRLNMICSIEKPSQCYLRKLSWIASLQSGDQIIIRNFDLTKTGKKIWSQDQK